MNGANPNLPETAREQHSPPHYSILKVVTDIFQPNMPPACFGVYSALARRDNFTLNPNNSMRKLAAAANVSPATASRAVETLVHLELIERTRHGGSQPDSYKLLDAWEAAKKWGAEYVKRSVSYSLPQENRQRLKARVKALQAGQRSTQTVSEAVSSVSPVIRQRFRGKRQRARSETQTGTHLIQEEKRNEESPSPTPSHDGCGLESAKDLPDEDGPEADLRWAQTQFTGVMDDLRRGLLDINRPPVPHLANGAADWDKFGMNSWGVEAAARRGNVLELTLRAADPAAAVSGLAKYRKRWEAACRKWFGCEVEVKWERVERRW